MELTSISLVLLGFYFVWSNFGDLPEQVPVHWDWNGHANRWDTPTQLFMLPGIGLFMYLFMTIMSFFPSKFKYPMKVTDSNRAAVYAMAVRMLQWTKLLSIALTSYISYATVSAALSGGREMISMWPVAIFVALTLGISFYTMILQKRVGLE